MQPGPEDPYNEQRPTPPSGSEPPGSYPPPGGYQQPGSYPPPGSEPPGGYQQPGAYPPAGSEPPPGYQQPAYQQPAYQQPGAYPPPGYETPPGAYPGGPGAASNTQGLVGMILGILSIPLACCGWGGIVLGAAGAILGYLGRKKADQGLATNRGQAQAALICGAVGFVLGVLILILSISFRNFDWTTYYNNR
ncbi:MAG TPA: hypothetical protein VH502_13180 [Actinoplanes sp.]|jgi:hypothetical protein